MPTIPLQRFAVFGATVTLSLLAFDTAAATALTLIEALEVATTQAPTIAANEAGIAGAQALVTPSDALPDPRLVFGVANLPVDGPGNFALDTDDMTMEQIGVVQEVPNASKRRARRTRATATVEVAQAQARLARLRVLRDTAVAWVDVYYAERRLIGFAALDSENQLLADAIAALVASGSATPADAVLPKTEAVRLAERRDVLVQEIAAARARLRRYVGAAADSPLGGTAPAFALDHAHAAAYLHTHPALAVYTAKSLEAQAEVSEAAADKRPDWAVEFAYQHREAGSDMLSLQLSIDLPVFSDSRQDPRILARQNEVRRLDAEAEALLRMHAAELESKLAEHARLDRSLSRYTKQLVPLAEQRVALTLAAYRAGQGDLQTVIAARAALLEAALEAVEVERAGRALGADIHFAYMETLP